MKFGRAFAVVALCGTWFALKLEAYQEQTAPKITVATSTPKVKVGAMVTGRIMIEFAPGLHGYQNPPSQSYQIPVKIESETKGVTIKPTYPKGVMKTLMGEETAIYEGPTAIPFSFKAQAKPGVQTVKIAVKYQQCDDSQCWPPATHSVTLKVTVAK